MISGNRLPSLPLAAAILCALLAAAPATGEAQSVSHGGGEFGLGLIIGDPTGLNGKYFLSPEMAIDGSLGFGFIGHDHIQMNMDFLWHFGIQRWSAVSLDLYLGVGPMIGIVDGDHHHGSNRDYDHGHGGVWIGGRGPFGASLTFNKVPLDIFVEVALGLWIVRDVDLDLDAAIGVRYWF